MMMMMILTTIITRHNHHANVRASVRFLQRRLQELAPHVCAHLGGEPQGDLEVQGR